MSQVNILPVSIKYYTYDFSSLISNYIYLNIYVPSGFAINGNNVPRGFRWIIGRYEFLPASVIHDRLYSGYCSIYGYTRKTADKLYKDMLILLGCNKIKATLIYYTIRLFGGKYFIGEKIKC